MSLRERIKALPAFTLDGKPHDNGVLIFKSDVLVNLWEDLKCLRCNGTKAAVGKYLCPPGSISEHRFVDGRKGQQRKRPRRAYDGLHALGEQINEQNRLGGRRSGVERRGEG